MIGRLSGVLLENTSPLLLLDVQGVGYEVWAPMSTCCLLPAVGKPLTLLIHMVCREDAQTLYGFFSPEERLLFRELLRVSGVGPKLGLSILSHLPPKSLLQAIQQGATQTLTHVPGVGKKTAERLLIELRDRLADTTVSSQAQKPGEASDATQALLALGYKIQEASRALEKVHAANPEALSSSDLIRLALRELTPC